MMSPANVRDVVAACGSTGAAGRYSADNNGILETVPQPIDARSGSGA
jgi:hypothetical protein